MKKNLFAFAIITLLAAGCNSSSQSTSEPSSSAQQQQKTVNQQPAQSPPVKTTSTQTTNIPPQQSSPSNSNLFVFSNINLPSATVGKSYEGNIDFKPCSSYNGYAIDTSLPPGLDTTPPSKVFMDICRISIVGTPTQAGKFSFVISLSDSEGNPNTTQNLSLQINSK